MEEEYMTAIEAARLLKISRQYLYDLVKNDIVPAIRTEPDGFKIKPSYKFRRSDIEALLKKGRQNETPTRKKAKVA